MSIDIWKSCRGYDSFSFTDRIPAGEQKTFPQYDSNSCFRLELTPNGLVACAYGTFYDAHVWPDLLAEVLAIRPDLLVAPGHKQVQSGEPSRNSADLIELRNALVKSIQP